MQGIKHTKASHHMRYQPELMTRVDLILGDGIHHKLEGEAAQLSHVRACALHSSFDPLSTESENNFQASRTPIQARILSIAPQKRGTTATSHWTMSWPLMVLQYD